MTMLIQGKEAFCHPGLRSSPGPGEQSSDELLLSLVFFWCDALTILVPQQSESLYQKVQSSVIPDPDTSRIPRKRIQPEQTRRPITSFPSSKRVKVHYQSIISKMQGTQTLAQILQAVCDHTDVGVLICAVFFFYWKNVGEFCWGGSCGTDKESSPALSLPSEPWQLPGTSQWKSFPVNGQRRGRAGEQQLSAVRGGDSSRERLRRRHLNDS
ncbi:hypothetical protein STEG23_023841 [Scotinomys teguina]